MRKKDALESIAKLPDEFSIDEAVEQLIILEKIEKGRQQVNAGKINSEAETKAKLNKWLS